MTLEHVASELAKFGINIDTNRIRHFYPTSTELAELEDNLLRLLRSIEAHNRFKQKIEGK